LYSPADAKALLEIISILLDPKTTHQLRPVTTQPSAEESLAILDAAVEDIKAIRE
jgi:hypothetical protein